MLLAAVKAAGGQVLADGSGVSVGGWTITTGHGPITGAPPPLPPCRLVPPHRAFASLVRSCHAAADSDLESIKQGLDTLAAPEQFYGSNFLRLRHDASGTVLRCGSRPA